jgi:two-component system alkaline phosphatase synthesis response regulator PhoP
MSILLVEDEIALQKAIQVNLELEGYEVTATDNGIDALQLFHNQHFNLIILDIMLPELDGIAVCEKIRLINQDVPILFLTARDSAEDRVLGLKKGADDYLVKPFNLEELLLRIKNLHKRSPINQVPELDSYRLGDYTIYFSTLEAKHADGTTLNLTKKETQLLKLFIEREGQVISRQQILQYVWGYEVYPSTRTIDNFILSFRKIFEKNPKQPLIFQSVRGIGYRFVPEKN